MSIRPLRAEPCWEIHDLDTGLPPEADSGDGWPHFATRAEAAEEIARRVSEEARWQNGPYGNGQRLRLIAGQSFDGPCVGLFCDCPECDGKGEPIDCSGEGWTHLDPADPTPFQWDDVDVTEADDGKHYCNVCMIGWPWCDECDEQHPGDCPAAVSPSPLCTAPNGTVLDVPLFEVDS